jgi:type IV secretion system protein VirD4
MAFWHRPDVAHWSTPGQLRRAGLFANEGLILGKVGGQYLCHNGPEHALVVGTTQSRKTSSFAFPNLLSWRHGVICHDPKFELHPGTAEWRGTFSRVVLLSPTSSTSHRYNLLAAVEHALRTNQEIRAVQLVSQMLADPEGKGTASMSDAGKHFLGMAEIALNGLILYGLYTQRARSLGALRALVMGQPFPTTLTEMARYPHQTIQEAGKILSQTDGQNERSGIFSTMIQTLWPYSDPLIQRATDSSDFTLRDLRERARPISVYLSIPFGDQQRLRPWVRTVLKQLCDHCVSRKEGWAWKMLGLIDEVPSVKRLLFLADGLNYVAGYGFRLALITPTMKELAQTYGRDHHFLEGCGIKVICGVRDRQVADIFSGDLGETEVTQARQVGRGTWVRDRKKVPLLSSTALMDLRSDTALVQIGQYKVLAEKAYYKHNRVWKARSELQ